jgi:hypothetical protein
MKIEPGSSFKITVSYPWGAKKEFECAEVVRDDDGSIRWRSETDVGLEPCLDCAVEESERHITGWLGGSCDTTVMICKG